MSVGNSAGISFSGLGSGIDTESIITKLMNIENLGVTRLQKQQQSIQDKMTLYGQFQTQLSALRSAAGSLNNTSAFKGLAATSSDTAVATVTGSSGASSGSFALQVFQLAQAQKLASNPQSDATSALGLSGTFSLNGTSITVAATDSLSNIADKINGASAGVNASIITGGNGQARITFSSQNSGALNNLKISDTSGTVLQSLGFTQTQVRQAVTNGAVTNGTDTRSNTLNKISGFTATSATTVQINGQNLSIDPTSDTLDTLATKINALSGVTATVVGATEAGRTTYRLQITGQSGTPTFTDNNNALTDLGVLKRTSQLLSAQDALFSVDTLNLSSSSNTVTSAIQGATINLLAADSTNGKPTTVSLTKDVNGMKQTVQSFVTAYNSLVDWMKQNSQFDKTSFAAGPLFSDSTTNNMMNQLANQVLGSVAGTGLTYKNMSQVGVTFDDKGKLTIDDTKLTNAITSNSGAVASLFQAVGSTTGANLSFVTSTSKTVAGGATPYSVNITQAPTKEVITAGAPLSGTTSIAENLTFTGGPFSATGTSISIAPGSNLQSIVNQINNNSNLNSYMSASISNNTLVITSTRYGAPGNFSVVSSLAANGGGTGIGTAGQATTVAGKDVAGTINGETATGSGQYLTGKAGNATTEGLSVAYTGSTTGAIGSVSISNGVAANFSKLIDGFTDTTNGSLTAGTNSLQKQYDDLSASITRLQSSNSNKEASLRAKFQAMESAIAAAQQQSQSFASFLNSKSS